MTGIIVRLTEKQGKSILAAYRGVFLAYAIIAGCKIALSFAMTRHSEIDHPPVPARSAEASSAPQRSGDGERQPLLRQNPVLDPPLPRPAPGPCQFLLRFRSVASSRSASSSPSTRSPVLLALCLLSRTTSRPCTTRRSNSLRTSFRLLP